jgi:hypothetical protein
MVVRALLLLALNGLAGCGGAPSEPPDDPPHLAASARQELIALGLDKFRGQARVSGEEWNGDATAVSFDPASGPLCLLGAPYVAHLKKTGTDRALVFLGGGGACWDGFCRATPIPDAGILPLGPLHVEVASNPFHEFNVLYLPYCDGSVFSGDNDVPHEGGKRHFRGRRNLAAGLDLLDRLGKLRTIVIAGVSAGAYGTLAATATLRLRYPSARIVVYNDSGPWIQNLAETAAIEARIRDWHFDQILPPACVECAGGRGQLTAMMDWLLRNDDQLRVGMMSFYQDAVIGETFNNLPGDRFKTLLLAETGKLRAAHPARVRRFMLTGTAHVLSLYWPNLVKVNGVTLRDWTAALVRGDDPAVWDLLGP